MTEVITKFYFSNIPQVFHTRIRNTEDDTRERLKQFLPTKVSA